MSPDIFCCELDTILMLCFGICRKDVGESRTPRYDQTSKNKIKTSTQNTIEMAWC
jgi:hypothetical protein